MQLQHLCARFIDSLGRCKAIFFTIAALLHSTSYCAEVDEEIVMSARLSVVGFQCSALASTKQEEFRLFEIGVVSGRRYIELAKREPDALKRVWLKVPGPYLRVEGPSTDFLVGRVQGIVEEEIFKIEMKSQLSKEVFKFNEYNSRNCGVVR